MTRPDILLLEGTEETIALGTGSALSSLVLPYQGAGVDFRPQLKAENDGHGLLVSSPVLRMPGSRLSDLAGIHKTIHRVSVTLSTWRFGETNDGGVLGWGWHRYGRENADGRAPLYAVSHGDGIGWLLGSHRQLMWALHLNCRSGRTVTQMVISPPDRMSSVALADTDLDSLLQDLLHDGKAVTSWVWSP